MQRYPRVYSSTTVLPFLGRQTVRASILGSEEGRLEFAGALSVDETFYLNKQGETWKWDLGPKVRRLLVSLSTELVRADLNEDDDTITVVVKPFGIAEVYLRLQREDGMNTAA